MANGSEGTTDSPRSPGLQRLLRSWSGRNVVETTNVAASPSTENVPAASVQPSTGPADAAIPLHRTESATSSQRHRLSFGDRFRRLSKDFGRLTGVGKGSVSEATVEATSATGAVSATTAPPNPSGHAKFLSLVAESEEPVGEDGTLPQSTQEPTEPDSPDSLAKRIQDIIDHLPLPTAGGGTRPILKPPKPPARDKQGRPIPPPNASPVKDAELIRLLSSATIMNGSREGGRPSIWSVLETISAPPHALPGSPPPPVGDGGETNGDEDEGDEVFPVNSSVMMYSPIIPGKKDLVELAELVPVAVEEEPIPGDGEVPQATAWTSFWPLNALGAAGASSQPSTSANPMSAQDTVVSRGRLELNASGKKVKVHTVRAWVPSQDKLSVQVMWWGYRMYVSCFFVGFVLTLTKRYLPPPVLDILSDKTIEAAKRAAMITTALTWFFNNLPISSMPLPIQPTLILLQRLAPYLGYIGTFISWSWGAIKKYDIGESISILNPLQVLSSV